MTGLAGSIAQAQHCADLFRLGRDVEAGLLMVDWVTAVQPSVERLPDELQQAWGNVLGLLLDCQERQNWLALADYLQYEAVAVLQEGLSS
ncbi:hypothetical protein RG836_02720 [Pseudomonas sp. SZMC_28357]|uniref:hypothetical protein n=1 Tax=Pseudomonas sp. SZMC_28357 TaxID=3074380 RepID=UPI0028715281|nr:hypothetical protein [Pseudomonas sp. SZMC_28357]MDR9750348.1 hypothetical protein [Pseudomonas sp. SZMC_28357]